MREFPQGRWINHSVWKKDTWIQNTFWPFVQARIKIETNKHYKRTKTNEWGEKGLIRKRFYKHADCVNAFKNYFCYLNFPRCDLEHDLTLPTCKSACENFFKACGYRKDMYRCGPTKFMNAEYPENVQGYDANGNPIYHRGYFPGQPFRHNHITSGGSELPVCTPALMGNSNTNFQISIFYSCFVYLCIFIIYQIL